MRSTLTGYEKTQRAQAPPAQMSSRVCDNSTSDIRYYELPFITRRYRRYTYFEKRLTVFKCRGDYYSTPLVAAVLFVYLFLTFYSNFSTNNN